jgi:hypothetical protein
LMLSVIKCFPLKRDKWEEVTAVDAALHELYFWKITGLLQGGNIQITFFLCIQDALICTQIICE